MPIPVTCVQGHTMQADDALAGQMAFCMFCGVPVAVPAAPPVDPLIEPLPPVIGEPVDDDYEVSAEELPELPIELRPEKRSGDGPVPERIAPMMPATNGVSVPPLPPEPLEAKPAYTAERPTKPRRPRLLDADEQLPLAQGYGIVNVGLGFHYFKVAANLLAFILVLSLAATLIFSPGLVPIEAELGVGRIVTGVLQLALLLAVAGLLLLSPVLGFVGSLLCLWVPPSSRAARFIWTSFILELIALPLVVTAYILQGAGAFGSSNTLATEGVQSADLGFLIIAGQTLGSVCTLAAWVLFVLFLWRLCQFFRQRTMSREALAILYSGCFVGVGYLLIGLVIPVLVYFYGEYRNPSGLLTGFLTLSQVRGLSVCFLALSVLVLLFLVPMTLIGNFRVLRSTLNLIGSVRQVLATRAE